MPKFDDRTMSTEDIIRLAGAVDAQSGDTTEYVDMMCWRGDVLDDDLAIAGAMVFGINVDAGGIDGDALSARRHGPERLLAKDMSAMGLRLVKKQFE